MIRLGVPLLAAALMASSPSAADDINDGKSLAEGNCAICHAIGPTGASTLNAAPPFRDIAQIYERDELEDAFNEGVPTDHPAMPDWQMTPEQARQLAAYIMSLQPAGKTRSELKRP